ncbi:hypothetical protein L226DRAFT_512770 [Lentinus tigrinus ALCF2SS1-7]|uniref:DUF4336 domain-containing protein n=1 Tax=Lentinus tigrinus ALCF2SS1-6 TaxID=1328759 RepID=A0A5C2S288_9APHY|nr:hypothetical protein L227DRAFT_614037 [Lentinus tigrinus ALCF2SS1-6]RPD71806.1 hypothetical protein L226DRAFT_512770 [Lentinus tigrinus ALCF2SS1-7]
MTDIVIREVVPNVWTFSRPFTLFGLVPVGGRSTAIKLDSGGVWILASTPLTDETKQKLAELGDVKYIAAGNHFHNLFLKSYKEAYPGAKLIGPDALTKKKEFAGLTLDAAFSETNPEPELGFEDEVEACYFSGHANKDIAFYHKASKTVITADLLFNIPATEQFSKTSQSPKSILFGGMKPKGWQMPWFIWAKQQNKTAMVREAKKVYSWDFDRLIPCHGDVIETGAKAAWKSAWGSYLS